MANVEVNALHDARIKYCTGNLRENSTMLVASVQLGIELRHQKPNIVEIPPGYQIPSQN